MTKREFEELRREIRERKPPLRHPDHPRPITRRQMLAQGFIGGAAMIASPSLFGFFRGHGDAWAQAQQCGVSGSGGRVPFICIDLGGGANIAGSSVLTGGAGGQLDFLSDSAYSKLGLPNNQRPQVVGTENLAGDPADPTGLRWHPDSPFLKGIRETASVATLTNTDGCVVCARSDNDTQNNPHNPMYGINKAGANGALVSLIGTNNSDSGGRSVAPMSMIDLSVRPVRVSDPGDAMGLVDTGKLASLLPNAGDAEAVIEAAKRMTDAKLDPHMTEDAVVEQLIRCSYVESQSLAAVSPASLNPMADPLIVGQANSIFTTADLANNKFESTATVMKLVCNSFAGAGTIAFGGYDYHNGTRATGEERDFEAGMCIGAILEYSARLTPPTPVMIYVFSDGSVASDGQIDNTADQTVNGRTVPGGGGKGVWRGDNSGTSAGFFLVFDPTARPALTDPARQQIGYYRTDNGSVETGATVVSNNVDVLAEWVVLNFLALHGDEGTIDTVLPGNGLSAGGPIGNLIAFSKLPSLP